MIAESRAYDPTRSQVINHFERIAHELDTTDRRLERAEYNRAEVGRNWAGWFRDASRDLSLAGHEFSRATGGYGYDSGSISRDIDRAARDLAQRSDEVARMDYYNQQFGRGWGRVLDGAIETVQDALRELDRSRNPY